MNKIQLTDGIRRENESIVRNVVRKHETKLGRPIKVITYSHPVDGFDDEWVIARATYEASGDARGPMWQRIYVSHSLIMDVNPKVVVAYIGRLLDNSIAWFMDYHGLVRTLEV